MDRAHILDWTCELSGMHWGIRKEANGEYVSIEDGASPISRVPPAESEPWVAELRVKMKRSIQWSIFQHEIESELRHCPDNTMIQYVFNEDHSQARFTSLDRALSVIRLGGSTVDGWPYYGPNIILDPQLLAEQAPIWIPTKPMTCQELLDYLTTTTGTRTELRNGAIYVTKGVSPVITPPIVAPLDPVIAPRANN